MVIFLLITIETLLIGDVKDEVPVCHASPEPWWGIPHDGQQLL